MRKTTILAVGAAILLATAASAQQQPAPQPTNPPASEQPAAPAIQKIDVVTIDQLPEATQARVNEVISQRSNADLQKLRESIDATPQAKSALEAKGLSSADVIVASLTDNGTLTLITKKKAS